MSLSYRFDMTAAASSKAALGKETRTWAQMIGENPASCVHYERPVHSLPSAELNVLLRQIIRAKLAYLVPIFPNHPVAKIAEMVKCW